MVEWYSICSKEVRDKAFQFIEALGGADNVVEIAGCITRLRGTVVDSSKVDLRKFQKLGIIGRLIFRGKGIQIVGTHAGLIGTAMNEIMRGQ